MARPLKVMISKSGAVKAALAVIDDEGVDKFGLALVAKKLGVKSPSFYHHFKGKDEILGEVARLLLIEGQLPPMEAGINWRSEVVRISLASWRSILRHPRAAPLLLRYFPRALLLGAYEHWAKFYALNGVPPEWHVTILEGCERLTFGSALFTAASRAQSAGTFPAHDADQFPFLAKAMLAHPFDEEQTFVETLHCFLRGVPVP